MKVNLIDYTGAGSADKLYALRLLVYAKNTRLTQGEDTRQRMLETSDQALLDEVDGIVKTIRSSWEFVDYTFEVLGVTRAFTHQMVRTRTASYAQQAQRVADMSGFGNLKPNTVKGHYMANIEWDHCMAEISKAYDALQKSGIPNQDARGVLPTNVLTNIIIKFNLRTFADLCGKRDNPRAQGEYVDVIRAMKAEACKVHPWVRLFLEPQRTTTPNLDSIMYGLMGEGSPVDKPQLNAALKEIDALKGIWG